MKKLLIFTLLLQGLLCHSTNVYLSLTDARLQVGPYYTNRTIFLQPASTPTISSPSVVLSARIVITNDSTGAYTYTNLYPGLYYVTVAAPPSQDMFAFYFDSTNYGTINASDYLVAMSASTFPAGSVAWSAAVTDARYLRSTNVQITYYMITNALGFSPMPASGNLTNWSFFLTNVLSDIPHYAVQLGSANLTNWSLFNTNVLSALGGGVTTNGVLGIGSTNWVAMDGGGSTNQILKSPSMTNAVNYGNALSSKGTLALSEQFGNGATATALGSTALGAGAAATASGGTALGENSVASGAASVSVGQNSFATVSQATALGVFASAGAANSTAIGENAQVNHANSTAVGQNAVSSATHQVTLGTSSDGVYAPGSAEIVGSITNDALTGFQLVGSDNNKKLVSVAIGAGLAFDGNLLSVIGSGLYQIGSANLTNWSLFDTNVLSSKVNTNGVVGIGTTNWVGLLNGGSTNQVLLNPSSTNLVNRGNALRSVGSVATADQFGLSATASGANSVAVGSGAAASLSQSVALGYSSAATVDSSVALGAGATVTAGAVALGAAATAQHSGSSAIGPSATTTRANQIMLGIGEEVNIPGKLVVGNGLTNSLVGANKVVVTDANNRETGATLGNGLSISGTTLSLSTDSTLSTSGGSLAVVGSALTGLNATTAFSSGTTPTARLGSGSATSSTYLRGDSTWATIAGGGTVSSVGLTMPAEFVVASSPVTGTGTIGVTKATQSANMVYAGPTSGLAAVPGFRVLVAADVPSLTGSYWGLAGNTGAGFLGTTDNQALNFKTHSITAGSLSENNGLPRVQFGHVSSFSMLGDSGAILGGETNYIGINEVAATIVGGAFNTNSGGGGSTLSANTIVGGASNLIGSAVRFSTVLGGFQNSSFGAYSIVGGRRASSQAPGQLILADSTDATLSSSVSDAMEARYGGGVNFTVGLSNFCVNGKPSYFYPSSAAADQNISSTTLTASSLTSQTLAAGHKYNFEVVLFVTDSVAADGVKLNMAGGSVVLDKFRAQYQIFDTALLKSTQTTAINTTVTQATITGDGQITIKGYLVVQTAGTMILQIAQNSHSSGTLTLYEGSYMRIYHDPN